MRKAEEIKKELAAPVPVHYHVGDPEPRLTPLAMCELEALHADALALIQQLEEKMEGLISDFEEYDELPCALCEHYDKDPYEEPCRSCNTIARPDDEETFRHWKWRGVQKEVDHNAE